MRDHFQACDDHSLILFQVVANECGTTVACLRSPPSCSNNRDCNVLITYKYLPESDQVEYVISGSMSWIAVAQVEELDKDIMVPLFSYVLNYACPGAALCWLVLE